MNSFRLKKKSFKDLVKFVCFMPEFMEEDIKALGISFLIPHTQFSPYCLCDQELLFCVRPAQFLHFLLGSSFLLI